MKVIGKMTGLRLLEEITNNNLSCGTMIRYKREDIILPTNPPKYVYEYYIYTGEDKRFHRCNENGKLGANGQQRFMCYATLKKEFEILEEDKKIEKLEIHITSQNYMIENENAPMEEKMKLVRKLIYDNSIEINIVKDKINELIDEVNKIKESK